MEQLRDRIAVVTGAGNGIGRSLAIQLAREGMDVAVADIALPAAEQVAAEVRAEGRRALAVQADVGDRASVEALAGRVFAELGGVHILCNNAGVIGVSPLTEREENNWRWLMQVNLWGVVYGLQTFLPRMTQQGDEGHIVNTASIAGLYAEGARNAAYTASKYAVVGISEALSHDLDGTKIGVSVLCPSSTRTDIFHNSATGRPAEYGGPWRSRGTLAQFEAQGKARPNLMDPFVLARRVVKAVRERRLYVVGDIAAVREHVEARFNLMLTDIDHYAAE